MVTSKIKIFSWLPAHEKRITLSTWITLARIASTPFIVFAISCGYWGKAAFLFLLAALTDTLDGNLARLRNEQTILGACLDPIADKILILSSFFTLAFAQSSVLHVPLWFVLCVLAREVIVIVGVVVLYFLKGIVQIDPTVTSKITTLVQIIFISWLFACYYFHWLPLKTYYLMLAVVMGFVLVSLVQYLRIGIALLRREVV